MIKRDALPTDAEIVKFEMLNELAESIYAEMKEFSKKKLNLHITLAKVHKVFGTTLFYINLNYF